jgi:O-antigen/teichoic acid export membrane protein
MSDIKRFFKHSSIYAIGNIINRIGAFVLLPVYTNYLSVAEYGIIEIFYVISSVVSGFLAIGLAHATLRFYFEYQEQRDRNAVVSTNLIGSLVISLAGSILVAIMASTIAAHMLGNTDLTYGIYIILITLVFELSSQICLAYIRAVEYSILFVGVSIAKLLIQVGVNTYLVVVMKEGINGVLIGNMVTVIAGWLVLSVFTLRRCGVVFHFDKFVPVIKYSFPFLLSTIIGLVSTNVDKIMLNYMISLEALGLYALALKFSMIIEQLVGEPFSRSYGAFRYTIMHDSNAAAMQASIVKYLFIFTMILSLGMCYFVSDVLHIMSAEEYWPAASIVPVVMIASIIRIMTYPAQSGILFAKQTRYFFYFTSVAAVVGIISNFTFIKIFGLVGACIGVAVTELCVLIMTHRISQRYFKVDYDFKSFIVICVVTAIFFPVIFISAGNFILSIVMKMGFAITYIFTLYKLPILTTDEKTRMVSFISSKLAVIKK